MAGRTDWAPMDKTADAFRTISEVAEELDLPQHVLRFWETRFSQIRPMKRTGGRRYYRREDVALLRAIRALLYTQGYKIAGVQRILKEQGARGVIAAHQTGRDEGAGGQTSDHDAGQTQANASSVSLSAAVAGAAPVAPPPSTAGATAAHAEGAGRATPSLAAISAEIATCARILRAARE